MPSSFQGADNLWNKFQENLVNYINNPSLGQGHAVINNDYISRPNINEFANVLLGLKTINSLDGFDPCN